MKLDINILVELFSTISSIHYTIEEDANYMCNMCNNFCDACVSYCLGHIVAKSYDNGYYYGIYPIKDEDNIPRLINIRASAKW